MAQSQGDNEEDEGRTYMVRCVECGHRNADGQLVGVKTREVNRRGNAELLARIHALKTGHSPVVS